MNQKTINILLIAGAAGVIIYLVTRPTAAPVPVSTAGPITNNPLAVAGSSGILSSLMNSLTGPDSTARASVALPNPANVQQAAPAPATDNYILPGTVSAPILMNPPIGDMGLPQDTSDGFSTIYDM
jgi:hypothetical protein